MDDTVKNAREAWLKDRDAWQEIYRKSKEDMDFLSDDAYAQWERADYSMRASTGRPALTIDQLSQFVHQVANDIRMNTPTITTIPSDGASDIETAEVFKGLIRNIEYVSSADDAYDTAVLNSIRGGLGFIRVDHDYESDDGFNQQLLIKRVVNPLACWIDADSIELDGRDAKRGTVIDRIKATDFKRMYKADPVSFDEENIRVCQDDEYVSIAEQFFIDEQEQEIALLDDGRVVPYEKGVTARTRRKVKKTKVRRIKVSGADVLEETIFPGKYIPLIPVYGEELWINGKRNLFSLIRKSKDAQRMFNLWKSLETELLLKQPRAPVMVAAEGITGHEAGWANPDKQFALVYNTRDSAGNPLPPPQRLEPPVMPAGIINAARGAVDDIKATMGMYNASLGQRSNEQSGKAIMARQQEGDVATYHFGDNLMKSITQVGRVLVSAIPEVYDTARVIRIIGEEEESKSVGINGEKAPDQEREYDLTQGKYDVRVIASAPFTTKRQEAAQFYSDIVKQQPELMSVMGDLLFKYSDFSGAHAMSNRMKKVVDPKFLEDADKDDQEQQQDPEKLQMAQQLQAMQAQLQQVQMQIQAAEQQVEMDKAQMELKAQYDALKAQEQISALKIQNLEKDLQIAAMQAKDEVRQAQTMPIELGQML